MRKIDRRIVIVIVLIFTIGLAYGLMRFLISLKEEPKTRPQTEITRYVSADTVRYSELISPVVAPGRLASVSELDVVSEASGKIQVDKIPLKKGASFKKGDLLFTIYPDEASLLLQANKSQFISLLANLLPDIRIDYPDFENNFRKFYEAIVIDKPLPKIPASEDKAFNTFMASRNVTSQYYSILREELSFSRRSVHAPFAGTYTEVYSEEGAYANTGGKVARIIRTDMLELEIPLERFHSEFVDIGASVTVTSTSRNVSWLGKVIRKSQFVDPGTQSQSVFVKIQNSSQDPILAGEYLSAAFVGQTIPDVMEVNRNAVFNSNEVFIVIDGHLSKVSIDIVKINEKTLLFRGVEPGMMLVTQPLINVMEGTAVAIIGQTMPKTNRR